MENVCESGLAYNRILCKYRGCFVKLINWVKANSKTETLTNNIFIQFCLV